MKPERNGPGTGKRTDVFARGAGAKTDIAIFLMAVHFKLGRRNDPPTRVTALRGDEHGRLRQAIEKSDRGRGGEVGRGKPEMKVRLSMSGAGECASERLRLGTAPEETVMKQRYGRMKFRQ